MNSLHRRPFCYALISASLRRFSSSTLTCRTDETSPTSFVHPWAVIHPNPMIGEGVSIDQFCIVGPSAKLGNGCHLYPGINVVGYTEIGEHCVLMAHDVVGTDDLPGRTVLGANNIVGHHAVIGVKCQDLKYKVIGDNNMIMGSCHIAHDCNIGNHNILANNTLLAGYVVVEDYAHTASAVVVHQFCHIGSFSFLGGGSVVSQDVPKYTMVAGERDELRGLNMEGLHRRGFTLTEIQSLRAAYRKIFMPVSGNDMGFKERLAMLEIDEELSKVPVVRSMIQSVRDSFGESHRGICKFRQWTR
ncbi:Probable acyl-[acyl-carrier-protein]--UDP-N-acetylglucosamine O-acyltransferase, mitochondrial [Linum perenne]